MDILTKQRIKGYDLRDRIGAGGFGAVYKAYQSTVGREVAIKIILPGLANQPDFIRRFESEAQLVARLEHPHIVPLHDYWRDPEGAYLVMRWLRGGSLRDALQNNAFELRAAALLLDQVAGALSLAHRNDIIHRDIKPGNILLDEDGNAYLTDFGIAKDLNLPTNNTQQDAIVGSLDYVSPEQARSEPVTARTDIYSLGVTMYEVITGHHPFENMSSIERLYKHINEPLPEITTLEHGLQEAVNRVIQKATAKNPDNRYPDALALAADFREAAGMNRTSTTVVELLTQREQEILKLIIDGLSNKEIAQQLTVTLATVKWHVYQIYSKLGVRSRVQAIVRARELNLIVRSGETINVTTIPTEDFRPQNPYKGLLAFQSADNQDFFGREKVTAKLIKRLSESGEHGRFLAVVGPSGSGKSSLVKAGLIPALWRGELPSSEKWFVVEMLPGSRPLDELEIALTKVAANQAGNLHEQLKRDKYGLTRAANLILPNDGSDLVLIIDQFEEVFTLVEDEAARVHFLDLLHAAVTAPRSRVRVVITLRADFYDRPLHYSVFGELVRAYLETIMPLSAEELELAIARPAERVGVMFEPGLVAAIIGDVNYQPGALPLLQYALRELFERRQGRLLTHEAYQEIGGTIGALAKRAEDIYGELSPETQHISHQMFLRLVTLGEGTEDTRRRTPRSELLALTPDTETMDEIIDTFAAYRLLSLDNDPGTRAPTVEVAHEAILREWDRLRNWINTNREEIKMQQQLAHLTEEWVNGGKDTSYLVSGLRLEQFEKWAQDTRQALTLDERAYLQASLAERTRQASTEAERQQREIRLERRSQTFLRGLVAVLLLATLGAFGLTGFAVNQSNIAQAERDTAQFERERAENQALIAAQERERAEQQSRVAQGRELIGYANSSLETDAELSTLLALQAVNTTYEVDGTVIPEAESILHQAVQSLRTPVHRIPSATFGSSETLYFGYNSDGTRIMFPAQFSVTSAAEGRTGIADPLTGELLYTIPGDTLSYRISDTNLVSTIAPDGDNFSMQLWDVSSADNGRQVASVPVLFDLTSLNWLDVSLDFRFAITVMSNGRNSVWDLTTGSEIDTPATRSLPNGNGHPTFSPDGNYLLSRKPDGTLNLVDTTTWETAAILSPAGTSVSSFSFSPDGTTILTGNRNNTVSSWDTATGTENMTFALGIAPQFLVLNADGTRLAAATASGQISIWDLEQKQEVYEFAVSRMTGIAFSSDSTQIATLHHNGIVQIWDLIAGREAQIMVNAPVVDNGPSGLAYSPDGARLVVGSMSAIPTVWDANTGGRVFDLLGHTGRVLSAAWSPSGEIIVTAGEDTDVILWDAASGEVKRRLSGHSDSIYGLAFSPDNTRVASSSYDQTVRVWDVATGELLLTLEQPAWSKGVAFSPDGTRIAAGTDQVGFEGFVRVWDAVTGELQLDILVGNTRTGGVVFSPDGSRILVGLQQAHDALVIDAQTGEILLTLTGTNANVPGVAYSPDGSLIATGTVDEGATARIWDANTGQELLVLYNTPGVGMPRVAFSPDGNHLAVHTNDGTTRIYVVSIPQLIALAESRLTRTLTEAECQRYLHTDTCLTVLSSASLPVSQDNVQQEATTLGTPPTDDHQPLILFWTKRDGNDEIYVMNADGTNPVNLTNNPAFDGEPSWSPDGTKIAFSSTRDGNDEIYVMNADGTNSVRLTDSIRSDEAPVWSPDGTQIALQTNREGNFEIYVMNADGSNPVNLTNNPANDELPTWSPDGTQIAFTSQRDGRPEIYVINADGSNLVNLTNNPATDMFPDWSPDGTQIAFTSQREGKPEIYIMNADGSNPTRLTNNNFFDGEPAWSLDGTHIIFSSERDGKSEIYIMNADGSNVMRLTSDTTDDWWPRFQPRSEPRGERE